MVLRDHLDSDMCIEGKIVRMNYLPCDNKKELVKHLKMVKTTKQQVLITSKGNYIETGRKQDMCQDITKKVFQNIIDKD